MLKIIYAFLPVIIWTIGFIWKLEKDKHVTQDYILFLWSICCFSCVSFLFVSDGWVFVFFPVVLLSVGIILIDEQKRKYEKSRD